MDEKYYIQVKLYKKVGLYDFEYIDGFVGRDFNKKSIELLRDDVSRFLKMIYKNIKKDEDD